MIDLHLHSNKSDGSDSPSQLIDKALALKIKAIALTDHDNIDGVKEFLSYGENKDIIVLPGIEISIRHEPEREIEDVHIVGLNIDYNSTKLINTLKKQKDGRLKQKEQICTRLKEELGYNITYEEVKSIAGGHIIGRPHIVEIIIKNNPDKIKGKTKNDLFKMISLGGTAYVDREYELNFEESIEIINSAGGIPIIAHPGIYKVSNRSKFIEFCVNAGIKGIEIEYTYSKNRPFYNTEKAEWAQEYLPGFYRKLAEKFNLVKSGGSDYHGGEKGIKIGEANVPEKYLKDFI
ncbi:MAG: PHP domain-containing protein [Promethearchaeota archaeon]|nr:MAG: PHP domain-containing protein [Candidatus Lokiarchaeota archaeon]